MGSGRYVGVRWCGAHYLGRYEGCEPPAGEWGLIGLLRRSIPTLAAERRSPEADGRVHLVEGRRGRGKSYLLTYWAWRMWLKGIPVRANFSMDLYWAAIRLAVQGRFPRASVAYDWLNGVGFKRLVSWDDVFEAIDCVVMFDEAHHYVDSRAFRDTPPEFTQWIQQSRKLGLTLLFASQSFEFLDLRVRRLSDVLWQARVVPGEDGVPKEFYYYGLDPWYAGYSESVIRDRADYVMRVPFDVGVARLYSTLELIEPPSGRVSWRSVAEAYKGKKSSRGGKLVF